MSSGAAQPERTNAEGEDLAVPLPQEWDLEALRGMRVVLYQNKISPPCCKIRALLKFYKVPFETVEGKKPDSDYKKIPVLDVGDRQINDSFIIVKSLAPILQGRPLTEEELEVERVITSGLMIALEKRTAGSMQDLCSCGGLLGGGMGCMLRSASCCLCCVAPKKIGAGRDLLSLKEYGDALIKHLGSGQFMGGGDAPGVLDLSVFGLLEPFVRANCGCIPELFDGPGSRLAAWHQRMLDATRGVDIFG